MKKLSGETWIPLSVATVALLSFGGASFTVGGFYQRSVSTETEVQEMKGDVAAIKVDIAEIKRRLPAKPEEVSELKIEPIPEREGVAR